MNKNRHIVIIGASDLVLPAYQIAQEELGLKTIAVDRDLSAPGMNQADIAVEESTKDPAAVISALKKLPSEIDIAGIVTCGADVEITVAEVAHALNLPGIAPEVAHRCNDKVLMHKHLDSVGFEAKAKYEVVDTLDAALLAAERINYPIVVKPLGNCGSRGVQIIETASEMKQAFDLAVGFNLDKGNEILIEECLNGTKHTVEMITDGENYHLISICDTHYISPRWPCETGLNITALSKEKQSEIYSFSVEIAKAMGLDFNSHKIDVNIANDGSIQVIELTARLSGGFHCQYASPIAYGTNEIRAVMRMATGGQLEIEDIRHKFDRSSTVRAIFPEPGEVVSVQGVEEAEKSEGVIKVFVYCKPGDIVGPYLNSTNRVAFVITSGANVAEANTNAEKAVSLISIVTKKI